MAKVPILIALLSQLLSTLLQVSGQQSPCPQYFTYINDSATNDMMGQIEIPSPPKNVELHLKVKLSINVSQSKNYVGQLELAQSKEQSVREVQQGPRATGQNETSIELEHTLPKVLPLSQSIFPINSESLNPLNTFLVPPSQFIVQETVPGPWPWLVAIFVVRIKFEFQCAGSILTNKHIITAASCLKLDQTNIPPALMSVSLGRYRLRDFREEGSINRSVEKYTIHPDYLDQITGDSDLAILVLRDPVEFSPRIMPVNIWNYSTDLQDVVNKIGYVVGWHRDEFNPDLEELRLTRMPIVSQEVCLESDPRFVVLTSNRTFCAGTLDGIGPCNGQSGSGLVIYNSTIHYYLLRGIASRSPYDIKRMTCEKYVVFVDVAKYLPAISRKESFFRIRRFLMEVALDQRIEPEVWQKVLVFASSEISGSMDVVLKMLKGLLDQTVLLMNIAEL